MRVPLKTTILSWVPSYITHYYIFYNLNLNKISRKIKCIQRCQPSTFNDNPEKAKDGCEVPETSNSWLLLSSCKVIFCQMEIYYLSLLGAVAAVPPVVRALCSRLLDMCSRTVEVLYIGGGKTVALNKKAQMIWYIIRCFQIGAEWHC